MNRRTEKAYGMLKAAGLVKKADPFSGLTLFSRTVGEASAYQKALWAAGLVALASGGAILAAKATAHDKRSESTFKKMYGNAQLEANIRNLKAKLQYEAQDTLEPDDDDSGRKAKSMRI